MHALNFALGKQLRYYLIMSEIVKSQWQTDGNSMRLSMPLAKVDKENRLVSGFATLDNVDSQGDIVTSDASIKAFSRARGNLREMHQPIAVGKIVDFREDEWYDTNENKFYRGIFVTAYVSKGAEATWEKVLDGTLTGFSIGGNILEQDNEFDTEIGKSVRFIKDYELIELSLVDNPANQLANVFSITKASNGSVTVKGMAVETEIENVFWCGKDERVQAAKTDELACGICGTDMETIGWFEEGSDRAEKVRNVVTKFLGLNRETAEGEGGVVEVSDNVEKSETPAEETQTEETPDADLAQVPDVTPEPEDRPEAEPVAEVDEEVEATVDAEETDVNPDEVPDEGEEIAKKIDALHEAVNTSLEATRNETTEKVSALEKQIADVAESFTQKASELESKFNEFGEKLEAAKSRFAELEKALEIVNSSGAVKKSGEDSPEPVQKSASVWNGAFSVDTLVR